MTSRNLLQDIGAQREYVRDLRVYQPHKKQQIAKAVADFKKMKSDALKTRPELGKTLQRNIYKLSSARKQAVLEKLAQRVNSGEGWRTAGRVSGYGGMGALAGSFLTKGRLSGRLAAGGIAGILGGMVAGDIGRSKQRKALRQQRLKQFPTAGA